MSSQKINILLVDDRPENLLALEAVLSSPEYNLVRAYSGEEALKYILTENFALILLDVQMPGLDGFETARLIRLRQKSKNIPIVFITAFNQASEYVIQGYKLGATDYIIKPFHPDTLRLKIESYIKTYQDQETLERLVQKRTLKLISVNKSLKEAQRKVANILGSIQDMFYTLDKNWQFTYVNEEFVKLTGKTREQLLGQNFWDQFPKLKDTNFYKEIYRAMHERMAVRFENFSPYFNVWYEISAYPSDEGLSVYSRDITKRKQMEANLRNNQQRLEALVKMNNMSNATVQEIGDFALEQMIQLTGSKLGYLAFVNEDENTAAIFCYSKNTILECHIADKPLEFSINGGGLWAEAIRQRKAIIVNEYIAENNHSKSLPKGHVALKRVLNVPIFDGERIVMLAVAANKGDYYQQSDVKQLTLFIKSFWTILQRRNAEAMLRESEDRFRNLFENSMDGVLLTKPDGTVLSANPALCQMLGRSEQEICQIGISGVVDLVDPRLNNLMSERQLNGQCKGELNLIHKNGSIVPGEVTCKIFRNGKGEHFCSIFVRDISERIRTQQI